MCEIHIEQEAKLTGLPYDILAKRLSRERNARMEAERLLEQKSLELYNANQDLAASLAKFDKERTLLSAVFNARSSGLVLTDDTLRIVRLNTVAATLLDVPQSDVGGQNLISFLAEEGEAQAWVKAHAGPESRADDSSVEGEVGRSEGENIPVRISCADIGYDGLLLWILVDVRKDRAHAAEKQMLERTLNQAQKMEALGTLASGVAHEINTPIQYVGDNVKFLKEFYDSMTGLLAAYEPLKSAVEKQGLFPELTKTIAERYEAEDIEFTIEETPVAIEQSLHGLEQVASIVSAIREFSHPGDAELKQVDINSIIETTVSVSRNSWKHNAELNLDLADNLPEIIGHPGDLHQVFINLLGNAADAIEEKELSKLGQLHIRTTRTEKWVEVTVADNGVGIDEATMERVFDPFFTTKAPGKGTGQGLAIVYKIVQVKHGGQIRIDSKPGKGTTFTLKFPIG
ncbi:MULTISPECIES: sensor histidine kinase [unclassified Roseibium]|jgi:two-component system NtrC family sensor kinase|uniref:sensor histidine kinase n=1 Tax=unclassified Roseibium TaxID=2629323 RepID=UPI00273F0F76|nr:MULTISPECIES: ATP-binding protein [unclassified Roseibium]